MLSRYQGAIMTALFAFSACQTYAQSELQPAPVEEAVQESMTTISSNDFATTKDKLQSAIESRGLTIFAVVDHAAGAEKAGLSLPPSTLFIFGNPQGGTPLMQANPTLGLDLPLKALVYEDGGEVKVLTTDIRAVTARAGVAEPAAVIDKVSGALAAIAADATTS
ncbi:MAG: DUF302 domain-containing protein [Pseudomonadota bacterium]